MNSKRRTGRFRESLPSEWVKYLVVAILAVVVWMWAFDLYHEPKDTEKIELFFSGEVRSADAFERSARAEFPYLKSVGVSYAYPDAGNGNAFKQKYGEIALLYADVVIITETVANQTQGEVFFAEWTGEGEPYLQGKEEEKIAYGAYLSEEAMAKLSAYFVFNVSERYVVCAVAASVNAGEETDHAIRFIEWLLR